MRYPDPRVDERKAVAADARHELFTSGVLPRFLRRTPSVEGAVAVLYLKGISTNDFDSALQAIYGEQAASLSAATVSRLKEVFTQEYEQWRKEKLSHSRYAYIWADGVYFNARVEGERNCVLVVVGATFNGEKELLAITNGVRESEASWKELLLDLKKRGMSEDPKLAIADGALGFWKALPQVFASTRMQRCWVHKTANVLGQAAEVSAATRQDADSRYLSGRDRRNRCTGVRSFLRELPRQVSEGGLRVLSEIAR